MNTERSQARERITVGLHAEVAVTEGVKVEDQLTVVTHAANGTIIAAVDPGKLPA